MTSICPKAAAWWVTRITSCPASLRWHGGHLTPHARLISSHVYVLWDPLCPLVTQHFIKDNCFVGV
jgi:hypothetical protein